MTYYEDFLKDRVGQLSDLLDISDEIAKGHQRPFNGQFQFLKLSIDARLRMLERMLPDKQEHSGSVHYVITREDNSSGPIQAPSSTETNPQGTPSV